MGFAFIVIPPEKHIRKLADIFSNRNFIDRSKAAETFSLLPFGFINIFDI